jgi:hypothetical protein
MRTDRDKRADDAALFPNAEATGPHAPGPTFVLFRTAPAHAAPGSRWPRRG